MVRALVLFPAFGGQKQVPEPPTPHTERTNRVRAQVRSMLVIKPIVGSAGNASFLADLFLKRGVESGLTVGIRNKSKGPCRS